MESAIVTKESFLDWKANPVTKAVFQDFTDRILQLQEELGDKAGVDPLQDRWIAGVIAGYKDIILINFPEVSDGN